MAYSSANLQCLCTAGDKNVQHYYTASDNLATVTASGYFNNATRNLNNGDIIFIQASDASAVRPVSSATGATTVTLGNYSLTTTSLSLSGNLTARDIVAQNANTDNTVGLTIDQNDSTNNPVALRITNAGSGADISTEALTLTNGKIVTATGVGIEIEVADTYNATCLTLDQNDSTNNPVVLALTNAGSGADITTEALTITDGKIVPATGVAVEIEVTDTFNVACLLLDQNDTTNNPTVLQLTNAGTGADITTEALTITNGKIAPSTGVVTEIEVADTFNVACLTLDQNDTTNNPAVLVIENAGSGADVSTGALTLTNGKIVPATGVAMEIEVTDTFNVACLLLDQNDTTNNPTVLQLTNAGTGADITTEALTITNGKIEPATGVAVEIEVADTFNVACLLLDQNDTTNNPTVLQLTNAGTGADITTEALTITNGKIAPATGVVTEIEVADTFNVACLTLDQNDTTNNPAVLVIENAGSGADLSTGALTLTNGKFAPATGVAMEVEVADTFNVNCLILDQNDSTNNPAVLVIENAGSGNDITAPSFGVKAGVVFQNSIDDLSGPGAIDATKHFCRITTTGASDAVTLANGTAGQTLVAKCVGDGGDCDITPANMANGTSVNLAAVNDSVTFFFDGTNWHVTALTGGAAIT